MAFWDWIEKIAAKQYRAGKDALPVEITKGVAVADVDPSTSRLKVDAQLTGSYVEIGGVSFAVSGGDTLRNTATNKPDAAAAHAVIPFCYYFAVDTGTVEVTDGTKWVVI